MYRGVAAVLLLAASLPAQTTLSGIPVALNTAIGSGVPTTTCAGPNPSIYVQLDATTGRLWACTNASGGWAWEHLLQPIPAATTVQTFTQAVQGIQGVPGESAYQIAVDNGYSGTQAAWIASLMGAPGTNGVNGTNGTSAVNPTFTASAAPLAAGTSPTVSLGGTYPALNLAFGIPAGQQGIPGIPGNPGTNGTSPATPSFTFSASSLPSTSTPTSSVTGTYPSLNIALGIPAGTPGSNGTNGVNGTTPATPAFTGTATALASGATPTVAVSGAYPNLNLAFGVPAGATGQPGASPANPVFTATSSALSSSSLPTASISGAYPNLALTLGIPSGAAGTNGVAGSPGYLSGTTGTVTATLLTTGSTAIGTATIAGVGAGTPCEAAPTTGTVNNSVMVKAMGTAANTATVYQTNLVALAVAPSAIAYNVRCMP